MRSGPSSTAEAIVAWLIPAACREEVLGDLHERYRSPGQYVLDAGRTIPLLIASRIRRTVDPQVLLIQAFVFYMSFLGAAWLHDRAFLLREWSLLRLAIPAGMALSGLLLEDAYASPGPRSPFSLVRALLLGVGSGMASLPAWITFSGSAMSLLLSSAVRMSFPPASGHLRGINAPAGWLSRSSGAQANAEHGIRNARVAVIAAALIVLLAYQVWKRG